MKEALIEFLDTVRQHSLRISFVIAVIGSFWIIIFVMSGWAYEILPIAHPEGIEPTQALIRKNGVIITALLLFLFLIMMCLSIGVTLFYFLTKRKQMVALDSSNVRHWEKHFNAISVWTSKGALNFVDTLFGVYESKSKRTAATTKAMDSLRSSNAETAQMIITEVARLFTDDLKHECNVCILRCTTTPDERVDSDFKIERWLRAGYNKDNRKHARQTSVDQNYASKWIVEHDEIEWFGNELDKLEQSGGFFYNRNGWKSRFNALALFAIIDARAKEANQPSKIIGFMAIDSLTGK
ncbi:MAG: hypothetical protein AAGG02_14485, partial [Cyanobacteria bacterium P01_H01_bin.15]